MSKMEERKAFCARIGWELQRGKSGTPHRIIGANGVDLLETGGNYQSGYIDGLMDGTDGPPFKRARRPYTGGLVPRMG